MFDIMGETDIVEYMAGTTVFSEDDFMLKRFKSSIGRKMYLFIGITVFFVAMAMALVGYFMNADQIDSYFKSLTITSARNFASFVDPQFLKKLRETAESEEYQALRDKAEENDDEALIEEYLKKEGLWEDYSRNREILVRYLRTMTDLKYLYIVVWGDKNAKTDMYLLDDDDNPLYETGYYEEREEELLGIEAAGEMEPMISHGDWGWLCSGYAPVYDTDGSIICHVGCDVGMDDIMAERRQMLFWMLLGAMGLTAVVIFIAIQIINRMIVRPLNDITAEMKMFSPAENKNYKESGVMTYTINSGDEIEAITEGIRSMQTNVVDYINQIKRISKAAYKDPLTQVGSKAAYSERIKEMDRDLRDSGIEFAVVMVDVNNLKYVNDTYGHSFGDRYLKGTCKVICDTYKHSSIYRIGGDEFVVLLMGDDFEERNERLMQLRESFRETDKNTKAQPWERYSAASGMAEYASDDNSVELVFKRADKAMYEDKLRYKSGN